jgi:hypothetical protein
MSVKVLETSSVCRTIDYFNFPQGYFYCGPTGVLSLVGHFLLRLLWMMSTPHPGRGLVPADTLLFFMLCCSLQKKRRLYEHNYPKHQNRPDGPYASGSACFDHFLRWG